MKTAMPVEWFKRVRDEDGYDVETICAWYEHGNGPGARASGNYWATKSDRDTEHGPFGTEVDLESSWLSVVRDDERCTCYECSEEGCDR